MDKNTRRILYSVDLIAAIAFFVKTSTNYLQGYQEFDGYSITT